MMGILKSGKVPCGQPMMNMNSSALLALLAGAAGPYIRGFPCCTPSYTIAMATVFTASPIRMRFGNKKLRLPFSHASKTTERLVTIEVRSGPFDFFSAPIADADDSPRPSRQRISCPCIGCAFSGTEPLAPAMPFVCRGSAKLALPGGGFAPSSVEIACRGTVFGVSAVRRAVEMDVAEIAA